MNTLRARIRVVALAWLLCQAASLAAFVPGDCCISHAAEAAAKKAAETCHDGEPAPEPADHHEGAACPMHKSRTGDCCAMKNACGGPGQALANLFAYVGVIMAPAEAPVSLESSPATLVASSRPAHTHPTPDAPPPKV